MTKSIYLISFLLLLSLHACEKDEELLVYTEDITSITDSSVWVTALVSGPITAKGIIYGFTNEPTLEDNTGIIYDYDANNNYGERLIGLQSGTLYYVRAFAQNDKGVVYGETKPFYTFPQNCDAANFPSVTIGGLCWTRQNVYGNKYLNGDRIDTNCVGGHFLDCGRGDIIDYCYYYNYTATTDHRKICPEGWHVPTQAEWDQLINSLGGSEVAGRKMKTYGTRHWKNPDEASINESGFEALPNGYAMQGQPGWQDVYVGQCLSATFLIADNPGLVLEITKHSPAVNYVPNNTNTYHSCRCVKD